MSKQAIKDAVEAGLSRRYFVEHCFRWSGRLAIIFGLACVAFLFFDIASRGLGAFTKTEIRLQVDLSHANLGLPEVNAVLGLEQVDFDSLVRDSIYARFPDVQGRDDQRMLRSLYSSGAVYEVRDKVRFFPSWVGQTRDIWVTADDDTNLFVKGDITTDVPESERRIKDNQASWLENLEANGDIRRSWNSTFFMAGDSREPEQSGIASALIGSLLTMLVTFVFSFPIGVAAAIYLEEMAPKNRLTELIEININNLAAVPSIIFGLLGLAVFINLFGMPRSAPLVGGLVLTLMTLPTIILTSRSALKSVPPSVREAALGMGASQTQMVFQHVLPLALPGMLTGAIIGMAQALGETAPLLMIGMVAFIVDLPQGVTDAATALPVQIFLWADSPERAFLERASAAIMVLMALLVLMNAFAIYMRKRLEKRW